MRHGFWRSGSWDSLSVLVDQLMGQPKFDPMIQPMATAAATTLMCLTFVLFIVQKNFAIVMKEVDLMSKEEQLVKVNIDSKAFGNELIFQSYNCL